MSEVSFFFKLLSYLVLVTGCILPAVFHLQTKDWALHSEAAVLEASVLHPLFNTEEHFAVDYWQPSMTQRQRLDALTEAIRDTSAALKTLGVKAFLESAGLIGWLRHNRSQLPWDSDGDLGILQDECQTSGATKDALARALGPSLAVLKFACTCQEDCEGDNRRMVGRVAHKQTGVCIDIFAYGPVQSPRQWQKDQRYSEVEWWERVHDHADFTFPKDALLPLQEEIFAGQRMLLPAEPREFLSWEYGRCLGTHVWPWRILLYTPPAPEAVYLLMACRGAALVLGSPGMNALPGVVLIMCNAAASMLRGGLVLPCMLAMILLEATALKLRPDWCAFRRLHGGLLVLSLAVCLQGLRGSIDQLWCQLDDFYLHPRRPKVWTLCLMGTCWDF